MIGEIITVINRTSKVLIATKDSRQYHIPPGESSLRSDVLPYAQTQNPVPGTEDPYTLVTESLIALKGSSEPTDPIPDEVLDALKNTERLDRSQLPKALQRTQHDEVPLPRGRVATDAFNTGRDADAGKFAR